MRFLSFIISLLLCFTAFALERPVNSTQRGIKTFEVKTIAGTQATAEDVASATVSVAGSSTVTDVLAVTATSPFSLGDRVRFTGTGATLFTGTATGTDYFIIPVDDTHVQIASSYANAIAGTAVDLTAPGSGTLYLSLVELKETAHGFITGDHVQLTTSGSLPAGLATSTDYWVIADSTSRFRLASSLANALAGTAVAWVTDLTDAIGTQITATQVEQLSGPAKNQFTLQFQSAGVYKLSFVKSGLFYSTGQMVGLVNSNTADVVGRISTYNAAYVTVTLRTVAASPAVSNGFFSMLIFGTNKADNF